MNRLHLMRFSVLPGLFFVVLSWANPNQIIQQERDPDFNFEVSQPVFGLGQGPLVCVDEGHNNVHTATGRYRPFADLLRKDGYRVEAFSSSFSEDTLTRCTLLVIANALGQEFSPEIRAFPHPSSFSRGELDSLVSWIRKGGALLLFADHAPAPAAAGDLGALLGVAMFDGYARGPGEFPDLFDRAQGTTGGSSHQQRAEFGRESRSDSYLCGTGVSVVSAFPASSDLWGRVRGLLRFQTQPPRHPLSGMAPLFRVRVVTGSLPGVGLGSNRRSG